MRFIIIILVCFSCGVKTVETASSVADATPSDSAQNGFDENNYESFLDLENYKVNEIPDASDIEVVDSSSVIVVVPSEQQVKEMEEKYGEDFYTIADDASFYQAEAMMRLDSVGVKKVVVGSVQRYVQLKGTSGSWLLDVRKEGAPEWNMIFFHVDKTPEIVSSIDVTTDKIKEFFVK